MFNLHHAYGLSYDKIILETIIYHDNRFWSTGIIKVCAVNDYSFS